MGIWDCSIVGSVMGPNTTAPTHRAELGHPLCFYRATAHNIA